jgi:hypothetical protein
MKLTYRIAVLHYEFAGQYSSCHIFIANGYHCGPQSGARILLGEATLRLSSVCGIFVRLPN